MHAVTMPDRSKLTTIKLPPMVPWKVKRGHMAHRSGSGTHHDKRTKRLRNRGDEQRAALNQE